ncbi:MAG TPA: serine hydrolase [Rhodopila sp.]|uniref:serine hydrolase domain-containing protein n=1 Tax=Rhodopila sp. TaxID=2480087 RepID=UPI002C1D5701|nr:serine hydrolase [Rhodopila sp.]HVY18018.1 serine hydrolase [Rhodopila sp.]
MSQPPWMETIFDRSPVLGHAGLVDPVIFDGSRAALRQRTVNFAARRYADMMLVSGLDRATADRHFRLRVAQLPSGLDAHAIEVSIQAEADADFAAGRLGVTVEAGQVTVRWGGIVGRAISRPGYGTILLGPAEAPDFAPSPIPRPVREAGRAWPIGDAVESASAPPPLAAAMDAFFAGSPGAYGVLIARPDRVLVERYGAFGAPDRATPSWSMTKAITCTVIGRLIHDGWLRSMHDPAPAPLWSDPRGIHHLITLDHLVRMRAGLGFPVRLEDGRVLIGFENSAVYQEAANAFEAAQRSIVATVPGAVFRYVNSGMNVLGAIIRDQIERRGLPYHATAYGLLIDRLGMGSYQHSADKAGNLIASGAGYATLRDYAKLGVLYLNDGMWNGERLLPDGWVDYALTPSHTGTSYAACFRSNVEGAFPDLPRDTAWASGASDQKIFVLRRHRLTVAVANETDHAMDMAALNRMIATAIDCYA